MNPVSATGDVLPLPLPPGRAERAVLVILRRMAAHGFRDASATMLALETFGTDFRRVLVLLRAFMVELARCSSRTIQLAPCCAMRMTADEGLLMETLMLAHGDRDGAEQALLHLARSPGIGETLSVACMLGRTLRRL
jgi:hypothetical protein